MNIKVNWVVKHARLVFALLSAVEKCVLGAKIANLPERLQGQMESQHVVKK